MDYIYFPGCSLESTGRMYGESLLAVCEALGLSIRELDDWNCCGATSYMSVDDRAALGLAARNLALAEKQGFGDEEPVHMLVPCAACYLELNRTRHLIEESEKMRGRVTAALEAAGLEYEGRVVVRHPLDVFLNDVGLEELTARATVSLAGMKIACYYGCQIVRPYAEFDDQGDPTTMDKILTALGAEVVDWPIKTRCCGGSLTGTLDPVGLRLSQIILREAQRRGASAIATACPLCQFNLECWQDRIIRQYGGSKMPVAFFTQFVGRALGMPERKLGLHRLFVPLKSAG
jgi:heterodisulfide reductase subunit B